MRAYLGKQAELRAYLVKNGADKQPHGDRMLLDHLLGVQGILQRAKSEEAVCHAGLFHSVYGTTVYKPTLIDKSRREEVQALIGLRAEGDRVDLRRCAATARPTVWEVGLSNKQSSVVMSNFRIEHSTPDQLWHDLLRLECANLLEQKSALHKFPFLMRHAEGVGMLDAEGFCV